jgi:hypothetical protein
MVKEGLLKFDGRPLFPERIAYTRLRASRYGEQAASEREPRNRLRPKPALAKAGSGP